MLAGSYMQEDGGIVFAWQQNDYVAIYTSGGTLVKHRVTPDAVDSHYGWAESGFSLVADADYYAYSPYRSENYALDFGAIPADYASQTQMENGDLSHLRDYDYQMGKFTTANSRADLSFEHKGCIFCVEVPIEMTNTFCSLTLSADEALFTTHAMMNVKNQAFTSIDKSSTLTLNLNNITIEAGNRLTAYLMSAPTDLNGKIIEIRLYATDGTILTQRFDGVNCTSGHVYHIINAGESSSLSPTSTPSSTQSGTLARPRVYSPDFSETTITTHISPLLSYPLSPTKMYNLLGQPVNALHKGITIVNGKKVLLQ